MTYNQLPLTIISPITGNKLELMPIDYPNGEKNKVFTDYDSSGPEWYTGPVAMYKDNIGEIIFIDLG